MRCLWVENSDSTCDIDLVGALLVKFWSLLFGADAQEEVFLQPLLQVLLFTLRHRVEVVRVLFTVLLEDLIGHFLKGLDILCGFFA